MQKIKKLSTLEAQKIAAGEVIERPVNVVKELVENSLDAGATKISVYVNEGGNSLIQVIDNGCGMNPEDAVACFDHHATSKISTIEDLNTLTTFGFRGEALSSIASVSMIILQTKETSAAIGTFIERSPTTIIKQEERSCASGTDIAVSDLYFNVPARKKFLKKAETQWRSIVSLYQSICLTYPTVHFQLFADGKIAYNCPPTNDLKNRMAQLFDHNVAEHMLFLPKTTKHGISLSGIISDPHIYRYNRNNLFIVINNRWIKNIQLSKAIMKGYANILPPERFPLGALFIECSATEIDINVHPRKEEVLFLHSGNVERLISQTIATALAQHLSGNLAHSRRTSHAQPHYASTLLQTAAAPHTTPLMPQEISLLRTNIDPILFAEQPPAYSFKQAERLETRDISAHQPPDPVEHAQSFLHTKATEFFDPIVDIQQPLQISQPTLVREPALPEYKLLGIAHKTYIMLEHPEGIFFVDQHAAHESILFEQWGNKLNQAEIITLLFPEIIEFSREHIEQLEKLLPLFAQHHIGIELFGDKSIIIRSAPLAAKSVNWRTLLLEFLQEIEDETQITDISLLIERTTRKLQAQLACKAAVKAGDDLSSKQIAQLLYDLDHTKARTTCPHGRPTGWLLRLYEIEKKFKRIV